MLVAGDETGLLKLVSVGNDVVKSYGEQDRNKAIMGFSSITRSQFSFARKNGDLEYWEYSCEDDDMELQQLRSVKLDCIPGGITSLYSSDKYNSHASLVHDNDGNFTIVPHTQPSGKPTKTNVKGPVGTVTCCSQGGVAFGGQENDLAFFDSNTQQTIWNAKNVPYDKLRLRVPIWITAIAFFNPEQTTVSAGCKVVTGTGYKQVRLYDTRAEPRPIKSFEIGDYRLTQIIALPDEQNIYVSDTIGSVFHYDLRTGRRLHSLTASDGAIRQMAVYDDQETMVCVGLDRHTRWHNISTQKHIKSTYLRNRINACLPIHDENHSSMVRKGKKRSRDTDSDGEGGDDVEDGDDMEEVDAFLDSDGEAEDAEEDDEGDEDDDDDLEVDDEDIDSEADGEEDESDDDEDGEDESDDSSDANSESST